jgi:hypothetical protein
MMVYLKRAHNLDYEPFFAEIPPFDCRVYPSQQYANYTNLALPINK